MTRPPVVPPAAGHPPPHDRPEGPPTGGRATPPAWPFVSVVVPVYNEETTIGALIESLLRQDYPGDRMEILVVDNGSTDGSMEVIRRYPVVCLVEDVRQGSYAARNAGITRARGDIIAFTDGDCVADVRWLRELVAGWDDPSIGGFVGRITGHDPVSIVERCDYLWRNGAPHGGRSTGVPGTCNIAYRREVFEQLGVYDSGMDGGDDLDFALRMMRDSGWQFAWNAQAVIRARMSESLADFWQRWVGYSMARTQLAIRYPDCVSTQGMRWHRVLRSLVKHAIWACCRIPFAVTRRDDWRVYLCEHPLYMVRVMAEAVGYRRATRPPACPPQPERQVVEWSGGRNGH